MISFHFTFFLPDPLFLYDLRPLTPLDTNLDEGDDDFGELLRVGFEKGVAKYDEEFVQDGSSHIGYRLQAQVGDQPIPSRGNTKRMS